MKYLITLKDGRQETITILKEVHYEYLSRGDASILYCTRGSIEKDEEKTPLYDHGSYSLHSHTMGFIRNEETLFASYRMLRNPIVKLELIA